MTQDRIPNGFSLLIADETGARSASLRTVAP